MEKSKFIVKNKLSSARFILLTIFILLLSTTFTSAISSYTRSAPAYTFGSQTSAYNGGQVYLPIDQSMCQAGQDFIIQVDPLGCTPSVVRSDLLGQQDVTVFCPIVATQLNPLIKVNDITSMIITPSSVPQDVLTVGYYPAAAALGQLNPQITTQFLGNIGYATVVLRRQPNESAMPNFVQGNLTAKLFYNIDNAAGTGRSVYYLPQITDQEWNNNFAAYSFWKGKGYVRLLGADTKGATIGVYSGLDSTGNARNGEKTKIATVSLNIGETSSQIYLPGFNYCRGGLAIKLQDLQVPDTMAKLRVDSDVLELRQGDQFLENKCTVTNIVKQGINQRAEISCNEDQTRSSFPLRINPKVSLSINGIQRDYSVGDKLYDSGTNSVYLGFIGNIGRSNKETDLYIRAISIPKDRGGTETSLTDNEISYIAGYDKFTAGSDMHSGIVGQTSQIGQNILAKFVQGVRSFFTGKNLGYLQYSSADNMLLGTNVRIIGYAGAFDSDLSGMPPDVRNNYTNAINDYQTIKSSFSGEKYPSTDQITIGEKALSKAIDLANNLGQKRTALQLCQEFSQNYNLLTPSVCSDQYLLSNMQVSGQSVLINGRTHLIAFEGIREPSFDEFGLQLNVRFPDGHSTPYELSKNDIIYLNDLTNEFIQLTDLDENSATLNTNLIGTVIRTPTQNLKKGTESNLGSSSYSFSIQKINLQRVAQISIDPQVDYTRANSTFNFKIGIEKRAIQLSPAQTKSRIQSLNSTIQKLTKVTDTLGKIVTIGKTACLATEGVLTIKNFLANLGGTGAARQIVMRSKGGWYDQCNRAVKDHPDQYSSVEACLQTNSNAIDSSVTTYNSAAQQQNQEIQQLESGISSNSFLGEHIVNTDALTGRLITDSYRTKISTDTNNIFTGNQIRVGNTNVNIGDIIPRISSITTSLTQAENLQLNSRLLSSSDPSVAAIAKSQVEKTLGEIYSNSQASVQRTTFEQQSQASVNNPQADYYTGTGQTEGVYRGSTAKTGNIFGITDGVPIQLIIFNNQKYTLELEGISPDSYRIKSIYNEAGAKLQPTDENFLPIIRFFSVFKARSASSYQNPYINPEVRYYETDPYKGLPAVVPFDLVNGWYAAVKSELPILGGVRVYAASGRVSSFYLCNVGPNGREENMGGDDQCASFIPGTNQAPVFQGLSPQDAQIKMSQAVQAIKDATNAPRIGASYITINTKRIKVGNPATNIPDIKCEDFMSPSDCNILFNVCDPVVCPSSRCNLGGAYPVADVIQSGVAGSIALCLPNYPQVKVPICVSGVNAGLDAYNSVLKSYQQCLQTSLATGQTVGICDELNSVYQCQFFWSQGIPIIKYALPKIAGSVLGQSSSNGGGEYLAGSDAVSNAQKSIDYFSQYYAANSYAAFKARSSQGVGDAVCKNFISLVGPQGGNLFNTLTAPDSPSQFYGNFQEIPYETATNPPASQYKVFYHIYSGRDFPAYYQVYLRGTGSSFYQDTSLRRQVASGYIKAGDFNSSTVDFTAPSGYKELCIVVNGQEQCGFQQVTTDFGINNLAQQYASQQASQTNINTEAGCVSGTPSAFSFLNPNVQAGVTNALNPAIYNQGIIRICATSNPGQGTDPSTGTQSRWQQVGTCGQANIKCWLDTDSVKNVIKNANILNQTLKTVGSQYVQALQSQGQYLDTNAFESLNTQIKGFQGQNQNSQIINIISQNIDKIFLNNQKAFFYLLRGNAYGSLATQAYNLVLHSTTAANSGAGANINPNGYLNGAHCAYDFECQSNSCDPFNGVCSPTGTRTPTPTGANPSPSEPPGKAASPNIGYNYPILTFHDGTITSTNLEYTFFSNDWHWCAFQCDNRQNWYIAQNQLESEKNLIYTQNLNDKNRAFIPTLAGRDYLQGLRLLMRRTTQNSEGGILPCVLGVGGCTALKSANVGFSYDGTFTVSRSGTTNIYFKYDTTNQKWSWSPDKNNWVLVPITSSRIGSLTVTPSQDNLDLISALQGKALDEGTKIIFSIDTQSPLTTTETLTTTSIGGTSPTTALCTTTQDCQKVLGKRVIQLAQQKKQDRNIVDSAVQGDTGAKNFECLTLQLTRIESGIQQCKQSQVNNDPLYCQGDINNLIGGDASTSGAAKSLGIMQINTEKHADANVAYFDANVNYGLDLLISNSNLASRTYICNGRTYSGWTRALRQYNGWPTTDNIDCSRGNPNYVEDVTGSNNKNAVISLFPECGP